MMSHEFARASTALSSMFSSSRLFVLDRNISYHITVCKLFVFDSTSYHNPRRVDMMLKLKL